MSLAISMQLLLGLVVLSASSLSARAANLPSLPSSPLVDAAYAKAGWRFYASSSLPSGGYYFWKNQQGKHFFQYIQVNKMTSSNIYDECHGGLKGEMADEDIDRLKGFVTAIKNFNQKEPVQKPKPGRMSRIRKLTFRESENGREAVYKFYYKGKPDAIFTEFYAFAERFRGPMTRPCPGWP